MALKRITDPTTEPITVADAIAHLRCDPSEDNNLLLGYIKAVRGMAEHEAMRSLMTQTWRKTIDFFPCSEGAGVGAIRLDRPPIQSVTSVKYFDGDGVQQTLAPTSYQLDAENEPGWIVPAYGYTWPVTRCRANAVEVVYVAGYADADAVPEEFKTWMKVMLRRVYDNPDALAGGVGLTKLEFLDRMLDPHRVMLA